MADWPNDLQVAPIREWPGLFTAERRHSPFRGPGGKPTKLTTTLADLKRELDAVAAADAELLVAIPAEKFRRDGRPYANSMASHPGVILTFEIRGVGVVSYPCDAFLTWEDNLRAIVLSLEALRRVNRYGVTKRNEQYQGFLAIEAKPAGAFATAEDAAGFIRAMSGERPEVSDTDGLRRAVRIAKRNTHPDRIGGDASVFHQVGLAEAKLRNSGLL